MKDFEHITGGNYAKDPENPGHLVSPNKERYRPSQPATKDKEPVGARIDIPATKGKKQETMHYPAQEADTDNDGEEGVDNDEQ